MEQDWILVSVDQAMLSLALFDSALLFSRKIYSGEQQGLFAPGLSIQRNRPELWKFKIFCKFLETERLREAMVLYCFGMVPAFMQYVYHLNNKFFCIAASVSYVTLQAYYLYTVSVSSYAKVIDKCSVSIDTLRKASHQIWKLERTRRGA